LSIVYREPSELKPSPFTVRKHKVRKDIDVLVDSMRLVGVLNPLLITNEDIIIDGRRRWSAGILIKDQYIDNFKLPCLVHKTTKPNEEAILSLITNYINLEIEEKDVERQILLLTKLGYSLGDISKNIGISEPKLEIMSENVLYSSRDIKEEQLKRILVDKASLSPIKKKIFEETQPNIKRNIIKQTELIKYFKDISVEEAKEIKSQVKKMYPLELGKHIRRLQEPIPMVTHLIKWKETVEDKTVERLRKEKYNDLSLLVERLLELWSNNELCLECESKI